jgi:hypothetical protein
MYDSVADLPLVVDSVTTEQRERDTSSGFTRATTVVTLAGDGKRGRGEDVTYTAEAHDPARWAELSLDVTGEYTLDTFSSLLADTDFFSAEPDQAVFHSYRRWGFESAALDLALRQADTTLSARLDRGVDPVSFVVSTRLSDAESDEPPTADRIQRWLDVDPTLTFKTDPTPDWPDDVIDDLAATEAIRILDFKGHYEGTEVENPADPELYERLLTAFPDAIIEDPALTEETRPLFDREERVSWDAPIHGIDDIEALPFEPSWLNIKPSRFGSVESLLDTIDYCEERDIQLYGGGQFELGVGRRQIQLLAGLFYPDGPNDVAPPEYNDPAPNPDVPSSPLDISAVDAGFDWE